MTIAEKLTQIAENSRALYEAGYEAGHVEGIDVQTIAFEDWHNGTNESSWVVIPHGLGVAPLFVALIADNISAIKNAALPDGIDSALIQTDATFDPDTYKKYNVSYIRWQGGASSTTTLPTSSYPNRLIAKVDEQNVYINSAAGSYAWAPSDITTYTLICCCDVESRNVTFGIDAGEVVDNSIMKVQAIELSFDDWFTADSGPRVIPHALGVDPDTVIILPSHYEWQPADYYDEYYCDYTVCARLVRSYNFAYSEYSDTEVEYYNANVPTGGGYYTKHISGDVITWNESKVNIQPLGDMVFAPKTQTGTTYKLLVIKHT